MKAQKKLSPIDLWTLCFTSYSKPKNVTRGCAARDYSGNPVQVMDKWARSWCSAGLITLFTHGRHPLTSAQAKFVLYNALDEAALRLDPDLRFRVRAFISFHDMHTYERTMEMWKLAREIIEQRSDKGLC